MKPCREYYIGVSKECERIPTLESLLQALEGVDIDDGLRVLICCSTRDTLEGLSRALSRVRNLRVGALTADSLEPERDALISEISAPSGKDALAGPLRIGETSDGWYSPRGAWHPRFAEEDEGEGGPGSSSRRGGGESKRRILIMTDSAVKVRLYSFSFHTHLIQIFSSMFLIRPLRLFHT